MFGMGFGEILVILVIALLVFGPDRLPTMIKEAASFIRDLRTMVAKARNDLNDSVADLGIDKEDLELLRELRNPKSYLRQKVLDGADLGLNDPELDEALTLDDKPPRKPTSARASAVNSTRANTRAVTAGTTTNGDTPAANGDAPATTPVPSGDAAAADTVTAPTGDSAAPRSLDAPPPFDPDTT